VAVLLHGFSACPQQYDELGPKLAKAGYEVFVPLFPGHGAVPKSISPRVDDVDLVPRTPAIWGNTTRSINDFVSQFRGEKVLVGLSQGSNMALRATQLDPNLYDRVVAISPKLRNESAFVSFLFSNSVHLFNIDSYILGMKAGWKHCEEVDTKPPGNRAGFCYMENRHGIAMLDFGKVVIDGAVAMGVANKKTRTQVQFILSHSDNGTCNGAALEVMKNMQRTGSVFKACIMPKEVPHAMFSVHDSPFVKPWNAPLFQNVENFLTKGEFAPGSSDTITDCNVSW
jgi:pimeloyl-ACP methyl ester carboxylesterase